ncbi:MAG: 16S rRNA processing protein RimM [Chitinispirillaceae bacterium]|nr:16S rRNA processing protein RimM [Chitinispirillaceae bacterium]
MATEWIAIGIVRRAVGLDGRCGIEAFGNTVTALQPPCTVRIGRDIEGSRSVVVEEIDARPGGYQCRFEGIDERTLAEQLRGSLIFIENGALPALGANEFYHYELNAMQVFGDASDQLIGTVVEVHNLPSMDTIEVALTKGGSVMLPFSAQAIERIDTEKKRITVHESFVEELLEL